MPLVVVAAAAAVEEEGPQGAQDLDDGLEEAGKCCIQRRPVISTALSAGEYVDRAG